MSYIGSTPTTQSFIAGTDYFNGDGSTTAFTLSRSVVSPNDIEAVVNNVVQQPNSAYTVSGTTITFTSAPSSGTSNIYVRYLSTTTQSITPSQNTVSYSTLNSDNQSKLGISFKNRIINGAMVIDQRNAGASVTQTTSAPYSVDRFFIYGTVNSKFTAQQNAGSVTPPTGFTYYLGCTSSSAYSVTSTDRFDFGQAIEGYNIGDLGFGTANAKTTTLSFWVRSSLTGTFGGSLRNGSADRSYVFSYTINSANTWEQKSVTITGDTTGTWNTTNSQGLYINFSLGAGSTLSTTAGSWVAGNYLSVTGGTSVVGTSGATFYITGVQLEVGTQATTFDYRNYGTELGFCQRYFHRIVSGNSGTGGIVGAGAQTSTTSGYAYTSVYPPMRAAPTITFSSLMVSDSSSFDTTATVGTISATQDSIYLDLAFAAVGAIYRPINLRATSNSSGRLDMNSEL
jgi:hypothetical protein